MPNDEPLNPHDFLFAVDVLFSFLSFLSSYLLFCVLLIDSIFFVSVVSLWCNSVQCVCVCFSFFPFQTQRIHFIRNAIHKVLPSAVCFPLWNFSADRHKNVIMCSEFTFFHCIFRFLLHLICFSQKRNLFQLKSGKFALSLYLSLDSWQYRDRHLRLHVQTKIIGINVFISCTS